MKVANVRELKQELKHRSKEELLELCLNLSKFKKENKELLTYLLFEASNEATYIENVKKEMLDQFLEINYSSTYYVKKSVRKILRGCKKYIRYSKKKDTEVELLLYFSSLLLKIRPSIKRSIPLDNLYTRQIESIKKKVMALHEDLQFDYGLELEELQSTYTKLR